MVYPDCRWGVVMFRCTEELKGLAIDYDSFDEISIEKSNSILYIDIIFVERCEIHLTLHKSNNFF